MQPQDRAGDLGAVDDEGLHVPAIDRGLLEERIAEDLLEVGHDSGVVFGAELLEVDGEGAGQADQQVRREPAGGRSRGG